MNDQRSLQDQLQDLIVVADARGLYDAVDFLRMLVRPIQDPRRAVVRPHSCLYGSRCPVYSPRHSGRRRRDK